MFSTEPAVSASPVANAPSASPVGPPAGDGGAGGDGAAGPEGYGGPSPGIGFNAARTGNTIGGIVGTVAGVPGLGAIGAGIGTAQDMGNLGKMGGIANPGVVDAISGLAHFGSAISRGVFGRSIRDQAVDIANKASPTVNPADYAAFGRQAVSNNPGTGYGGSRGSNNASAADRSGAADTTGVGSQNDPRGEQNAHGGYGTSSDGAGAGDGTVICTELYRQGLMPREIYDADRLFGAAQDAFVLDGYRAWANPVARIMRRSPAFTGVVNVIASRWAVEMAYQTGAVEKGSVAGWAMMAVGIPVCRMLGYVRSKLNASRQFSPS